MTRRDHSSTEHDAARFEHAHTEPEPPPEPSELDPYEQPLNTSRADPVAHLLARLNEAMKKVTP